MKVALCQFKPAAGKVIDNADLVVKTIEKADADMFVFPEMFLTDYTFTAFDRIKDDLGDALKKILDATSHKCKTVVCGGPSFDHGKVLNSAYCISDKIVRYDKINLPNFGPFSEKRTYAEGSEPVMIDVCGLRFGIMICYDIFFPELTKMYAMNGADAVICISASPTTSNTAFERVFPARAVESTVYMLFVNNIGEREDLEFFGKSRCLSPSGDLIYMADSDESVSIVTLEHEAVEYARVMRPTLEDTKVWVSSRKKQDKTF